MNYELTTYAGSYSDHASKFQTAANGGGMPWWGSRDLATSFALALQAGPPLSDGNTIFFFATNFSSRIALWIPRLVFMMRASVPVWLEILQG